MLQNRETGVEARRWGIETAKIIIQCLHGKPLSEFSNEFKIGRKRFVVKCAKLKTLDVGVTYLMLKRIYAVYGAFARDRRRFDLFLLTVSQYKEHMRPMGSKGHYLGMVRKSFFERFGKYIGEVDIIEKRIT